MKIIVLYEELAWYFINCLNVLAENHKCSILVFCKQINPDAPFEFNYIHPSVIIKDRAGFNKNALENEVQKFNPDFIFLGGWSHKTYLDLIKNKKSKDVIIGFDNQWNGSFKQIVGSIYFRLKLKPHIKSAFVPGNLQYQFAKKIGFKEKNISKGAYCCDYDFFHNAYEENKTKKKELFPKRFLFAGRYAEEKGIKDLWECFMELQEEAPNEWELWCLGVGKISRCKHPKIKHFGFIQPDQLSGIINQTGVFVLPSLFEPWGVVVHEYAAAGYPMICSDKVGAIDSFLIDGKNGFVFKAGDRKALKLYLKKFIEMSQEDLNLMSENSANLSSMLTPAIWADNLVNLFKNAQR